MKQIFSILLFTITFISNGQDDNPDFDNLVKLGEIYSGNVMASGDDFKKAVEELRTPGLNHIIDALIAVGEADKKLLTKEFLSKPSEQELKYWYVIREIHYNNQKENSNPRPNAEVAREILEKEIDSRWLLINYYYRIHSGIAKMFNNKNLSKNNFNLEEYGLENDTEKAIFFFSISNSLTERFRVLNMMKNYDKLLQFESKLPSFNGKAYYEYISFDFEDFDYIGYDKTESYKKQHLGKFYLVLNSHLSALAEKDKTDALSHLYFNSILFKPDYFKYSGDLEKDLKKLYNKSSQ
ncbi:hypothetical protein OO013_16335 [Mangrovivirga sp. M17]|uniref:Uncharacterized protein n=1 Tax=Mangrovivirga halotolerans TaxID=2993936 RepID=A0ABT3RVR1_9BACT|nr:hypothetical protein [Mangrovivirga halotolerans]MCX2745449.1 hypothetical protein [Mangrovivirga halotolerans]